MGISVRMDKADKMPKEVYQKTRPLKKKEVNQEEEEEDDDDDDDDNEPVISNYGNLSLTIIEGKNLPAMDKPRFGKGSSDPFCKIEILKQKTVKTRVLKKNLNPRWDETFKFESINVHDLIYVKVYDWDQVGSNDKMGTISIALTEQHEEYGVPRGKELQFEKEFNIASQYKDATVKIAFHYQYLPPDHVPPQEKKKSKKQFTKMFSKKALGLLPSSSVDEKVGSPDLGAPDFVQYQLRAYIYQARNLPAADSNGLSDPYVVMRLAGKMARIPTKKKTLNPIWHTTKKIE